MKKFVIVPMIAAAALGLAACKPTPPIDNTIVSNETIANTEAPIENITEEPTLNTVDANTSVVDNATAIDTASNATAK